MIDICPMPQRCMLDWCSSEIEEAKIMRNSNLPQREKIFCSGQRIINILLFDIKLTGKIEENCQVFPCEAFSNAVSWYTFIFRFALNRLTCLIQQCPLIFHGRFSPNFVKSISCCSVYLWTEILFKAYVLSIVIRTEYF